MNFNKGNRAKLLVYFGKTIIKMAKYDDNLITKYNSCG